MESNEKMDGWARAESSLPHTPSIEHWSETKERDCETGEVKRTKEEDGRGIEEGAESEKAVEFDGRMGGRTNEKVERRRCERRR